MPNYQQQPQLPQYPRNWANAVDLELWGRNLYSAIQRFHMGIVYLLNATLTNSTAAARSDAPETDECFAYTTDAGILYVAVDGAWVAVGGSRQARQAVGAGLTTIAVTLSPAATTANYSVVVTPDWLTTFRVTSKLTSGFTIDFGTAAPGGGGTATWFLVEDAT